MSSSTRAYHRAERLINHWNRGELRAGLETILTEVSLTSNGVETSIQAPGQTLLAARNDPQGPGLTITPAAPPCPSHFIIPIGKSNGSAPGDACQAVLKYLRERLFQELAPLMTNPRPPLGWENALQDGVRRAALRSTANSPKLAGIAQGFLQGLLGIMDQRIIQAIQDGVLPREHHIFCDPPAITLWHYQVIQAIRDRLDEILEQEPGLITWAFRTGEPGEEIRTAEQLRETVRDRMRQHGLDQQQQDACLRMQPEAVAELTGMDDDDQAFHLAGQMTRQA